jgi:hypothetical protein
MTTIPTGFWTALNALSGVKGSLLRGVAGSLLLSAIWAGGQSLPAWARPFLDARMTMGLPISPDYWYVVALSRGGSGGPRANLVDPNLTLGADDVGFVQDWDYLVIIKPISDDDLFQATLRRRGQPETDFIRGFNDVRISRTTRDRDTINLEIDLTELEQLDPTNGDVQVALLTTRAEFNVAPEETNLALDATRGTFPNYYRLSLSDQRQVLVEDPQRQETVRRSRELIAEQDLNISVVESIEAGALGILAANILTFSLEIVDR